MVMVLSMEQRNHALFFYQVGAACTPRVFRSIREMPPLSPGGWLVLCVSTPRPLFLVDLQTRYFDKCNTGHERIDEHVGEEGVSLTIGRLLARSRRKI